MTHGPSLAIRDFLQFLYFKDFDTLSNGEQFLMIFPLDRVESSGFATPRINIVENWFEELKERVPVP